MGAVVIVWLVIIAFLLFAIARIGSKVRNTPWLNNHNSGPQRPIDMESRRFFD